MSIDFNKPKSYFLDLQASIAAAISQLDGSEFSQDHWEKAPNRGQTWVLEGGNVIERGAVNFSHVMGERLPPAASHRHPELAGASFQVCGLSLIMHPKNPFVPTVHMNVRFFLAEKQDGSLVWWFGGGYDLTPYYGFREDCVHWHQTAKKACDPFGDAVYGEFKKSCDDYFFIKHRDEARGIGGLFFDDLNRWTFDQSFDFIQCIGNSFLPAYLPIVEKRKDHAYNDQQRFFQQYRRGRYVEFNLVHDRGTLFGLQFGGRIESILCSMPPEVSWRYNFQVSPGSAEADLHEKFLPVQDWV